jgi:hypothetical protein
MAAGLEPEPGDARLVDLAAIENTPSARRRGHARSYDPASHA